MLAAVTSKAYCLSVLKGRVIPYCVVLLTLGHWIRRRDGLDKRVLLLLHDDTNLHTGCIPGDNSVTQMGTS